MMTLEICQRKDLEKVLIKLSRHEGKNINGENIEKEQI